MSNFDLFLNKDSKTLLDNKFVPDCLVVEYNSKFPPPILYNLKYDENYKWTGYDDQGTSLQYWIDHLAKFDYKLVCCNITGSNAFFINKRYHISRTIDTCGNYSVFIIFKNEIPI